MAITPPNPNVTPLSPTGPGPANLSSANQKEAAAAKSKEDASATAKTDTAAAAVIKSDNSTAVVPAKTPFISPDQPTYDATPIPLDQLPRPLLDIIGKYAGFRSVLPVQLANESLARQAANEALTKAYPHGVPSQPANIDPIFASFRETISAMNQLRDQILPLAALGCPIDGGCRVSRDALTSALSNVEGLIKSEKHKIFENELLAFQESLKFLIENPVDPDAYFGEGRVMFNQKLKGLYNIFLCIEDFSLLSSMNPPDSILQAYQKITEDCFINKLKYYRPISKDDVEQFFKENPEAPYVIYNGNLEGENRYDIATNPRSGPETLGKVFFTEMRGESVFSDPTSVMELQFVGFPSERINTVGLIEYLNRIPILKILPEQLHSQAHFYHSNTNEEQADKILANQPNGSYLLRNGVEPGTFVFSIKQDTNTHIHADITIENERLYVRSLVPNEELSGIDYLPHAKYGINPRLMHLPLPFHGCSQFYHANIDEEQAKKLLADQRENAFLVRDENGTVIVTVKETNGFKNFPLTFLEDGVQYSDGQDISKFDHASYLLGYFEKRGPAVLPDPLSLQEG